MLENYLYSIPKRKKIFYGILICWLFFSLVTVKLNCLSIPNPFKWVAEEVTDNITDEIFTATNQSISEAIGDMICWFFDVALNPFGPDLTEFEENTTFGSISLKDFLDDLAVFTGMFISTLIFGFSMIIYFFNGKVTDSKDTPVSLVFRYGLAVLICYQHKTIFETVLKIVDDFYKALSESTEELVKDPAGFKGLISGVAGEESFELLGIKLAIAVVAPGVSLIILIIQLILIWKLIKGFLKLYAEVVSRYIVTMVLLLLFGAFGGTIVSNNTSQIFKSYLRTLFSSFVVMIFNITWFKGCFMAVLGGTEFSLLKYIFVLEILAFGLKFDGMLRSMGLGVATGGSRIGAAIGGAGRNLANSLRNANDARKAGGKLLQAGGLATGNKGMFDLGSKVGAGLGDLAKGTSLSDPSRMAAKCGELGKKINDDYVKPKDAANMLARAMKNPGDQEAMNAVKGLTDGKIKEGAQALAANSGIKINDAKPYQFKGADGMTHSGLKISGEKVMPDGTTHAVNGVISDANAFDSCQDIGDGMGLNCKNTLKNGETCGISEAADLAGQDAADALQGAMDNGVDFGDDGYIEKAGKDSNGLDAFNCYGDDGGQVGTISGDEFIAASDLDASAGDGSIFANAKDQLKNDSSHKDCSDFSLTGFSGSSLGEDNASTSLSANFEKNDDGSSTCTISGENGQEAKFNVPEGTSYADALSSDAGKEAVSNVGGNADNYSFTPSEYTATTQNTDGTTSDYKMSFEDKEDGTRVGKMTDSDGKVSEINSSSIGEVMSN
ncbi:MAG: hypothetical protein K6G06_04980, partial [Butyrivibrio sp.]|nr:hypothetical protein [Butyrivibrio sp.]